MHRQYPAGGRDQCALLHQIQGEAQGQGAQWLRSPALLGTRSRLRSGPRLGRITCRRFGGSIPGAGGWKGNTLTHESAGVGMSTGVGLLSRGSTPRPRYRTSESSHFIDVF